MEHLVLYDGECGLCHGAVRFILPRDPGRHFAFATLQGERGEATLARHGLSGQPLNTVFVVAHHGTPHERLLSKSDAALFIAGLLRGVWKGFVVFRVVPRVLRDLVYDFVARHRLKIFGSADACLLPSPNDRERFVD